MRISRRMIVPYLLWNLKTMSRLEWMYWSAIVLVACIAGSIAWFVSATGYRAVFGGGVFLGIVKAGQMPFVNERRRVVRRALAEHRRANRHNPDMEPLELTKSMRSRSTSASKQSTP